MFCTKCGNFLNDEDLFCSRCGNMVKKQNNETIEQVREECVVNSFNVGKSKVSYNSSQSSEILLQSVFERNADLSRKYLGSYFFYEITNFEEMYGELFEVFNKTLRENSRIAKKMLMKFDIFHYDEDMILNKIENFCNIEGLLDRYYEDLRKISERALALKGEQSERDNNRNPWRGGGFGINGAIKGAMLASVLNTGSNIFNSIGNGILKIFDNNELNKMKKESFESLKPVIALSDALYGGICAIGQVLYSILVEEKILKFNEWESIKRMEARQNNYVELFVDDEIDLDKLIAELSICIERYPFHLDPVKYLITVEKSTINDLYKLNQYKGTIHCFYCYINKSFRLMNYSFVYYCSFIRNVETKLPKLDDGANICKKIINDDFSLTDILYDEPEIKGLSSTIYYLACFKLVRRAIMRVYCDPNFDEEIAKLFSSLLEDEVNFVRPIEELIVYNHMSALDALNVIGDWLIESDYYNETLVRTIISLFEKEFNKDYLKCISVENATTDLLQEAFVDLKSYL